MVHLPYQFSIALNVMVSLDNCTHILKNKTFYNECDNFNIRDSDSCCEELVFELFGDKDLDICYEDSTITNYTYIKLECIEKSITKRNLLDYFGIVFLCLGIIMLSYCVIRWTEEANKSKKEADMERKRIETLNKEYNIQRGYYQTFKLYESSLT